MMTRLERYVFREVLLAFSISFLFFFLVFFLNQILLMGEEILSKKAPLQDVLLLMVFSVPAVLALAAPFASLLGVLLAVGRLSGEREILAAQACGVPPLRLLFPALVLGVIFSLGSFLANDVLLPIGSLNFGKVYRQVLLSTPALELGSYTVKAYKNALIVTGKVEGRGVNGLLILDKDASDNSRLIAARRADLVADPHKPGVLTLQMKGVEGIIPDAHKTTSFQTFQADTLDYNIILQEVTGSMPTIGPREMSSVDLAAQIRQRENQERQTKSAQRAEIKRLQTRLSLEFWQQHHPQDQDLQIQSLWTSIQAEKQRFKAHEQDKTLQSWKTELYQKFSIPIACICFIFLAFPLALQQLRKGITAVLGLGLFVAVLYWASLLGARYLSLELGVWPELALFLPDVFILLAGVFMMARMRS
ncbi:MAG: YjgP/YjgQ family permease [Spirochaetales bacterium]|nr:YjgP/YjgQ family permease [Spirochaetales bacterium]